MKILITGIRGFVGANLSKAFTASGHEVFGVSSGMSSASATMFSWEDVASGNLPQVDVVIHLAGKAHDTKNRTGEKVYFDVNTELTKKIFQWFRTSKTRQFYFFSSVKAVADRVSGDELTEDCVPAPVGPYGESKIAAENFIREKFDFSQEEDGKRVYIIRPCMIYGEGNKGNLNLLYSVVRYGFPWPLGAFENKRSFLSIENLEFILNRMLECPPTSGIYNVADDDPLSTSELIGVICEALGKRARIANIPAGLIRFVAGAGTLFHLPLNNERLQKLTETYVVSNMKIKQALGIESLPVSVRDGLAKTIRWFSTKA